MRDDAPVGSTLDSVLPCAIAHFVPVEARGNPSKAWVAMVSNKRIRATLAQSVISALFDSLPLGEGQKVIAERRGDTGARLRAMDPGGERRADIGPVGANIGEADVQTLAWLQWLSSPRGRETLGLLRAADRPRVLLASIDSDMSLIAAMHVLMTPWAGTAVPPCKVVRRTAISLFLSRATRLIFSNRAQFFVPGVGKKKRGADNRLECCNADRICKAVMGERRGSPLRALQSALNFLWVLLLPGCDFVSGFPRMNMERAVEAAARQQPIEVLRREPPGASLVLV